MNYLALNIRYLRRKKNMKQADLSKILGLKAGAISTYENERSQPSSDNLQKIAEYFDVKIDWLLRKDISKMESQKIEQVEEPTSNYSAAIDLELRIESVEKRLNLLARELAELKNKYENQKKT